MKKAGLFIFILILFQFISSPIYSEIINHQKIENKPNASGVFDATLTKLEQTHYRGDAKVLFTLSGNWYMPAMCEISISPYGIATSSDKWTNVVINGSRLIASASGNSEVVSTFNGIGPVSITYWQTYSTYTASAYHYSTGTNIYYYITNNTNDPRFFVGSVGSYLYYSLKAAIQNASGFFQEELMSDTAATNLKMVYHLEPTFIINSTYYNLNNLRCYVEQPVISDWDSTASNTWTFQWLEQDITNVVLTSPYYRLRLFDKETNALVFQDSTNANFSTYRTITIDSVKVQNNAAEPIVVSIADPTDLTYAATALYQANQSITIPLSNAAELDFSEMDTDFTVYDNENETILTGNSTHLTFGSTLGGSTVAMENLTLVKHSDLTYAPDFDAYFDHQIDNLTVVRNGHYQGAISFDADIVNSQGGYYSKTNFNGYITNTFDQHRKIMNITKANLLSNEYIPDDTLAAETGSYELWLYSPATNYLTTISFACRQTFLRLQNNEIYAFYGAWNAQSLGMIEADNWMHVYIQYNLTHYEVYLNHTNFGVFTALSSTYTRFAITVDSSTNEKWALVDALDFSWSDGYFTNRNTYLNTSEDLWNLDAYADWENDGHYQGAVSFDLTETHTASTIFTNTYNANLQRNARFVIDAEGTHRKVLKIEYEAKAGVAYQSRYNSIPITGSNTQFTVEFWMKGGELIFSYFNSSGLMGYTWIRGTQIYHIPVGKTASGWLSSGTDVWKHYRINYNGTGWNVYIDHSLKFSSDAFTSSALTSFQIGAEGTFTTTAYLDALDYSWASGYFLNRNILLNYSQDLWSWYAYPEWSSGYYRNTEMAYIESLADDSNIASSYPWAVSTGASGIVKKSAFSGHTATINITGGGSSPYILKTFSAQTTGTFEYYFATPDKTKNFVAFYGVGDTANAITVGTGLVSGHLAYINASGSYVSLGTINDNQWYHVRIDFDTAIDRYSLWLDGVAKLSNVSFRAVCNNIYRFQLLASGTDATARCYFSQIACSWESGFFINMTVLENTTASPLTMNYTLPTLDPYANSTLSNLTAAETDITVYPYASTLAQLDYADYAYTISDLYNNELETGWLLSTESEIVYTPPEERQLFISLADQQSQYLNWENYKIRVNNTLIYSNNFYREIGTSWNISIYTRFDKYITSAVHTVDRDENYIPITLTLYSLKIFNQQTAFLHYNITLDPNYYPGSTIFYSEWLAPNEIGINKIPADYYKITLMHNETGTPQYTSYSLVFNNDDILLVSSSNTIFAVLQNINNLGTEIDSQFTYVALNFTNTNSVIGSQTVLLEINFANTNTTLENMLLSSVYSFEYLNSTLETVFLNQENSFAFLNSSVNSIYSLSSNSFTFINGSLGTLTTTMENSFEFLNSSIGSVAAICVNSFEYLNTTIENSTTWMVQNFEYTNSQIANNQIALLTQFGIVLSNITNNSIDIMNNIVAVNSSISNLIADLENNVLLVNDTIYTAVLNVSTALAIDSNNILGNLSITYQQNEFLTELFKKTMFSELLNWSGAGYNYSLIEDQITQVSFVNNYRNEAIELLLQYESTIETVQLAAQESAQVFLPSANVTYRIRSINTGEYLTEWEDLSGTEIDLGYYEETVPATPEDIKLEIKDYLMLALFGVVSMAVIAVLYLRSKSELESIPESKRKKERPFGVRDTNDLYFGKMDRPRDPKESTAKSVGAVLAIIIIVFVVVYLLIKYGV